MLPGLYVEDQQNSVGVQALENGVAVGVTWKLQLNEFLPAEKICPFSGPVGIASGLIQMATENWPFVGNESGELAGMVQSTRLVFVVNCMAPPDCPWRSGTMVTFCTTPLMPLPAISSADPLSRG